MEINVVNITGQDTGRKIKLNDGIFGIEPNDHAIYLDVKQHLANKRQGTHKSKERNEVSGTTKKLKRQKLYLTLAKFYLVHSKAAFLSVKESY